MAGFYGIADVSLTLENAPGGTAKDIHNFVLNGVSAHDISIMMESTALGDSWKERIPIGLLDSPTLVLEGLWDTTATSGTHAILGTVDDGPNDVGRELVLTLGDSKTWTRDYRMAEYEVIVSDDSATRFRATLIPTGAAVWGP